MGTLHTKWTNINYGHFTSLLINWYEIDKYKLWVLYIQNGQIQVLDWWELYIQNGQIQVLESHSTYERDLIIANFLASWQGNIKESRKLTKLSSLHESLTITINNWWWLKKTIFFFFLNHGKPSFAEFNIFIITARNLDLQVWTYTNTLFKLGRLWDYMGNWSN